MVTSKSVTWTVALFELVASCAAFFGSLSIVCAQFQSTSIYVDKQTPSRPLIAICIGSLLLILFTVFTMMGLSKGKPLFMVPRILLLVTIPFKCLVPVVNYKRVRTKEGATDALDVLRTHPGNSNTAIVQAALVTLRSFCYFG
ncbi:unnamed protein product [Gongylonema pulchrum]|uniref:Aa_trans domain-containing protein n=1 Tax=Gongylonema pulchrum TaxID=637853 RepID=A0A183EM29_9BILA|nr:unnamed protein product [Gongylonema pulchrum]